MANARRRGLRGDSGSAAVEFAIVLPVLSLLLLGMIEFGFVMRDYLTVGNAVRIGARSASTGAGDGMSTTAGLPMLAQTAASAVQKAGLGLPEDSIQYIFVYEANSDGFPGASGVTTMPTSAAGCAALANCVVFVWDKANNKLVYNSGSWLSSGINACTNSANADSVGVYMQVKHPFLTTRLPWMANGLTVSDRAVMKFEPLAYSECNGNGIGNGGHA